MPWLHSRICEDKTSGNRSLPRPESLTVITIRQAYEQFYEPTRPQLSLRTMERYRMEILRWERHTANPTIDQITTADFQRLRASCLAAGLKPATIEAGIRTVLQVLRLCGPEQERREGLGIIPRVPFVGRSLRQVAPLRPTPTVGELRLLWMTCSRLHWPPACNTTTFWRAWIGLGFVAGLRLTDMLTLPRSAISGDTLAIIAKKTGIALVVPLPPWLMAVIAQLPTGGKLFPCRMLPCFIRRELRRLSTMCGLPMIVTPHSLRRASITAWTAINPDAGRIIHGEGLGIRDRYVNRLDMLRKCLAEFPPLG